MTVPLHCLNGEQAPEAIADDLRLIAQLPDNARTQFWDALDPALAEPVPDFVETMLDTFSRKFDLNPNVLGRALKASRFLVREASARGLDRTRLEEDILRLCGGPQSPESAIVAPILLSRYDAVRAALGADAFRATVNDHGHVLRAIEWRVDSILASSRGDTGGGRVGILTLGYGSGPDERQLTLHLTPDKLEELRRACERMLRA